MSLQYAKKRIIKDIALDDERIQVTGYIKNKIDDNHIILNDKTGEIKVNIKGIENFNFEVNDLINVIGDLEFRSSGEKLINADIVQDMNKLNFEYYQKLYQIKKELD
ncbi:MAG: hypothetical protein ACFE91_07430 [Promethearchaeota archaeon]